MEQKNRTAAFFTFGCKVNQVDTNAVRGALELAGYYTVSPEKDPGVLVVNSCAVTAESERKLRQKLRFFRKKHPETVLILMGCALRVSKNLTQDYPEVDLFVSSEEPGRLAALIESFLHERQPRVYDPAQRKQELPGMAFSDHAGKQRDRTRAALKIEDGCDHHCAYCIIPHTRGSVRSKPPERIQEELRQLVLDQGYKEIILVGINLLSYGKGQDYALAQVLQLAKEAQNYGLKRLRLGSMEPDLCTPELLEQFTQIKILCPQFHISLQSGSDTVLQRMRRKYNTNQFRVLAQDLRRHYPEAALTTDLIVGFPGETAAEFSETCAFVEEMRFSSAHVFPFSARPGTPAAAFEHQIEKQIKQARVRELLELTTTLHTGFLEQQLDKQEDVLLEEPAPAGGMLGHTGNFCPVVVPEARPEQRNELIPVRITSANQTHCTGVLI